MKISTRGRYGLRAMVDIAYYGTDKCVSLHSISDRQGISESYLEQLMLPLKKAGFVKSVRGSQGGYSLNRDPKDISVGELLTLLEGSMSPVDCVVEGNHSSSCGDSNCGTCVTKPVWEKIYESVNDVLSSISLYDLVNDYKYVNLKESEV